MSPFTLNPNRELQPVQPTSAQVCLRAIAVSFCVIALARPGRAQSPPSPPVAVEDLPNAPQAPSGTISGTLTDADGDAIPGANITLSSAATPPADDQPAKTDQPGTKPADPKSIVAVSGTDGQFILPNVPPGNFILSVTAAGFAPRQLSPQVHPGEALELSFIVLQAAANTTVQVTATQTEIAEAQINQEEKQRVIGVFPNFYVSYIPNPVPLDPKQKFELAFRTMVDPVSFVLQGVSAGLEQADNVYDWGQGAQGYAKRYFAGYGTFITGTLLGSAVFPIIFKQDPRYFYKGTGTIRSRALYAIANSVICKGDNHRWQPNYSSILGGLAASGISNAYYPAPNRAGAGLTFESAAIGTGVAAIANLIQEFVVRRLTPHIPKQPPPEEASPQKTSNPTSSPRSTPSDTGAHTSPPQNYRPSSL